MIHEDLDTLDGARQFYSTLSDNNGAAVIDDQTGVAVPPSTATPWNVDPKISAFAQLASSPYEDADEFIGFDASEAHYSLTWDPENNAPLVYRQILNYPNPSKQVLIYVPITSDTSRPIFVILKGTDSIVDLMTDAHMYFQWATGMTLYDQFQARLDEYWIQIRDAVYYTGDPDLDDRPKTFIGHSLGGAFASKLHYAFHTHQDFVDKTSMCYLFSPYVLAGPYYDAIVNKCKTDTLYKDSIQTYMVDSDPFSLMMKNQGFGHVHVYPSRITDQSPLWWHTLQQIKDGNPFTHPDHTIMNWTQYAQPLTYRQTVSSVDLTDTHFGNVNRTIETHLQYTVVNELDTHLSKHLALDLGETDNIEDCNYPLIGEDIQKYICTISKASEFGHSAELRQVGKDHVSMMFQPTDNSNNRMLYFSFLYIITSSTSDGSASYHNYVYCYRRAVANDLVYIAHYDYSSIALNPAYGLRWLRTKGNTSTPESNVHQLEKVEFNDFSIIYNQPQGTGLGESTHANSMRNKSSWEITQPWSLSSHSDSDELRRKAGTNPGAQPIFTMFGISGKTSFNTYIRTKSGYNIENPAYSAVDLFLIDAGGNDYYAVNSTTPQWWGTSEGLAATVPDTEVWNISYNDANDSWDITNTSTTNKLASFSTSSVAYNTADGYYGANGPTTLQTTDFPLTNTNLYIVSDGNDYYQIYIIVNNASGTPVKRYFYFAQVDYSSTYHYGYLALIDEDLINADFKPTTLFKIQDNVAVVS